MKIDCCKMAVLSGKILRLKNRMNNQQVQNIVQEHLFALRLCSYFIK